MVILYITSSQKGAGKTLVCAGLGRHLLGDGKKVGYLRPIVTDNGDATQSGSNDNAAFMKGILGLEETTETIYPVIGGKDNAASKIESAHDKVCQGKDVVIIEGIAPEQSDEIIKVLDAKVVIIEDYSTQTVGSSTDYKKPGKSLLGVIVNKAPKKKAEQIANELSAQLSQAGTALLGVIPEDRTLSAMNVAELAEHVQLPEHLAGAPYLQPFYGKASWSARSMFNGHLGWFDGDAANLQPMTRHEQAALITRIAGGKEALLSTTRELIEEQAWQAALQLTGHLIRLDPELLEARRLRIQALTALAGAEQNPPARHYYLSEAIELRDAFVVYETAKPSAASLEQFTLRGFLDSLAVNLDPQKSIAIDQKVLMRFSDAGEAFSIHVRRGVAEIRKRAFNDDADEDFSIHVVADADAWKQMLAWLRNPVTTMAGFRYEKGNALAFAMFMRLFEAPEPKLPVEAFHFEKTM